MNMCKDELNGLSDVSILIKNKEKQLKLLIVGDLHIQGKSPENRLDEYPKTVLKKLQEIVDLGEKIKADGILFLGDLFNSHTVSNKIVSKTYKILKSNDIFKGTIVGNHDELADNFRSYKDGSLGLLEELGGITVLQDKDTYFFKKGKINLQLNVTNYCNLVEEQIDNFIRKKRENSTHLIHLTHAYLLEKPAIFNHLLISSIWDKTESDITYIGHYHLPFHVEHEGKLFIDPGAVVRKNASLSEFRMPSIQIQTINQDLEIKLEEYQLKTAQIPEDVLDRQKIEEQNERETNRQEFMEKVYNIKNSLKNQNIKPLDILKNLVSKLGYEEKIYQDVLKELEEAKLIKEKRKGVNSNEED